MTDGLLEITLEDDDAVEMTTDSGFVKIGSTTTAYSASAVEEIAAYGGSGDNEIDLSAVNSTDFTSLSSLTIYGGAGNDTIVGSGLGDSLVGGHGNDTLVANAGDDLLLGNAGDDSLVGGLGADVYLFDSSSNGVDIVVEQSSEGRDWLEFSTSSEPLVLCLDESAEQSWGAGSITLADPSAMENVVGASFDDMVCRNEANNVILAGEGDDTIVGLGGDEFSSGDHGDDALVGGDGDDILIGGEGSDFGAGDLGEDLAFAGDLAFPEVSIETLQDVQGVVDVLLGAWTVNATVAERLANLEGAPGANNPVAEPYQLQVGETVLNDDDVDLLPATLDDDVIFLDSGQDLAVLFPDTSPIFREVDPAFEAVVADFDDGTLTITYRGAEDVVYSVENAHLKVNGADPLATPLAAEDVLNVVTQVGRLAGEIEDSVLLSGALANLHSVGFTRSGAVVMPEMTAEIVDGIYSELIGPDWTTMVEESAEEIADEYNSGRYGILFEILCAAGAGGGSQYSMMQSSQGSESLAAETIDAALTTDVVYDAESLTLSVGRDTWWRKSTDDGKADPVESDAAPSNWWSWWQKSQVGSLASSSMVEGGSSMLSGDGGEGQGDGGEGGTVDIHDAAPVNEGQWASFSVTVDAKYFNGFTVDWHTVDGSAHGGDAPCNSDYRSSQGSLMWIDGGEGSDGGVAIETFDDYLVEPDETFQVVLDNVQNADGPEGDIELGDSTGTGTIKNTSILPTASVGSAGNVEGGHLLIAVTLDHVYQQAVTVNWSTTDIDGEADDYAPKSGSLTFNPKTCTEPGETTKYIG